VKILGHAMERYPKNEREDRSCDEVPDHDELPAALPGVWDQCENRLQVEGVIHQQRVTRTRLVLNAADNSARYSKEFDLFHDEIRGLNLAGFKDVEFLEKAGFEVEKLAQNQSPRSGSYRDENGVDCDF
jgi:hypothetical protein